MSVDVGIVTVGVYWEVDWNEVVGGLVVDSDNIVENVVVVV